MINIGILGGSSFAQKKMIPYLKELDDLFSIEGIASRSSEKAKYLENELNIKGFSGYDSLVNHNELDAIYIPLPNSLHYEWIKKSLNKGLHVLVEKSLACTYQEADELNDLAKKNNLALVENFHFRFHKQFKFIKNQLNSGVIGELRGVKTSFGFPPFQDDNNIRYKKELGGGALLDAGAYPIKMAQELLGYDVEVLAATLTESKKYKVDIWGGGFIKQKNGSLYSHISFGFDNYYQCNVELWGNKGKIYTRKIFTAAPEYIPEVYIETGNDREVVEIEKDNAYKNMLIYFYKVIGDDNRKRYEYIGNRNQARLISEFINY